MHCYYPKDDIHIVLLITIVPFPSDIFSMFLRKNKQSTNIYRSNPWIYIDTVQDNFFSGQTTNNFERRGKCPYDGRQMFGSTL